MILPAARLRLKNAACFFVIAFVVSPMLLEASTEAWVRKASNATQQLAKGNAQGAVRQVVPGASYRIPETQTRVYAAPSGRVGVNQPIAPAANLSSRHLRFNSSYNAGASVHPAKRPNVSHGLNLTGQNRFFRNSTTVTPGIPNLNNDSQ